MWVQFAPPHTIENISGSNNQEQNTNIVSNINNQSEFVNNGTGNNESNSAFSYQNNYNQSLTQQNINDLNIDSIRHEVNGSDDLNYFQYILGALLKPFDKFKREEEKLNNWKNVSILSLIIIVVSTLIRLIATMISVVREKSLWPNEVKWTWENLKSIPYFKFIGQNLLIYAGILV